MIYGLTFGKNRNLSLAEILSYFETEKILWKFVDLSKKALVVDAEFNPEQVINDLGGVLKIIKIEKKFEWDDFFKQEFSEEDKQLHISIYGSKKLMHFVRKIFKRMPKDGVLENKYIVRKDLEENSLIIGLNTCYYGPTVAVSDPFFYKERDEKRPHSDYLTISPSRARILVNLAQSKSNVADPFCGVGTIGQEAMLRGVKTVFCSDILLDAVTKCRKNLKWTSKKYKTISTVIVKKADIRNFPFDGIQSWATEPDLGPALKEKPSKRDAEKILRFLKKNYDFLFKQLYEKSQKNARIAVIFPCINAKGKKIFMDKHYHGFEIVDLFKKIPKKFKDELKINRSNFILDEEREKGRSRTTIREFGVFRTLKK